MSTRIKTGYSLFLQGKVHLVEADPEHDFFQFSVDGSRGDVYDVYFDEGSWLCECYDWKNRAPKDPGAFTCKHITGCFFKLREWFEKEGLNGKGKSS